jgi:hypothetical protein
MVLIAKDSLLRMHGVGRSALDAFAFAPSLAHEFGR